MSNVIIYLIFIMNVLLFAFILFILIGWRWLMKKFVKYIGNIIYTDSYQENLLELLPGMKHSGIQNILENNLRSNTGDVIHRPFGSTKKWPHLDPITFIPTQTVPPLIDGDEDVDLAVTIGPKAKKPLKLKIPLIISGMAYGIALSDQVRLALAEAAKNLGTAINSGEGAVLPEELNKAGKYILQFGKTEWSKETEKIKSANMIEIKFGQGALFGVGGRISTDSLTEQARKLMGVQDNEDAVIFDNFFDNQTFQDLKDLVKELRELTSGVPIGAKIGAGGKLEEDMDHLIDMGVDYIAIDGGQAGTFGSPPIVADDMGIPTLHAVVRAVSHIEKREVKDEISLIVSGGLIVPGHFLKVLALGADAVYLGSAMLFAVSHTQALNALPFEPPTQAVWDHGSYKDQFKIEDGVTAAEKFLTSSVEEMKVALRAMGKRSLAELSKKDLVSYDEETAKMVGIPFSFEAWKDIQKE